MSFAFPAAPTTGQTYRAGNGVTYTWDGTKWTGNVGSVNYVAKSGDTMSGLLTVRNDLAVTGDITERGRNVASNFAELTLNVDPTGSANPADPIGDGDGSGDAFNSPYSCLRWAATRINVGRLYVIVQAGSYTDWNVSLGIGGGISELFIYGAGASTTTVRLSGNVGNNFGLNFNGVTLRLSGIKFTGTSKIRSGNNLQIGTWNDLKAPVQPTTPDQENVIVDYGNKNLAVVKRLMLGTTSTLTKINGNTLVGAIDASVTAAKAVAAKLLMTQGVLAYDLPAGQMNSTGWSRLQNGAILQYGTVPGAAPGQVITFPQAFQNAVFNIQVTYNGGGNPPVSAGQLIGGGLTAGSANNNLVNFKLSTHSTIGLISWMAMGY
jgi:hypothetical protein